MAGLAGDTLLFPGYDPVPCPMPRCGQPLHLCWAADQYLYSGTTRAEMRGMVPSDLGDWHVICEAGHVILVPPDDGAEEHVFGQCRCDPEADGGHDEGCADGDFDRLRELANAIVVLKAHPEADNQ